MCCILSAVCCMLCAVQCGAARDPVSDPCPAAAPGSRQYSYQSGSAQVVQPAPGQNTKQGRHLSRLPLLPGHTHLTSEIVCLLVARLMSQQHASVSQGRICTDKFTCCHIEIETADPTFYLTQSQYTDTGLTSPSTDPTVPGAWQGRHWIANFEVTGMT